MPLPLPVYARVTLQPFNHTSEILDFEIYFHKEMDSREKYMGKNGSDVVKPAAVWVW